VKEDLHILIKRHISLVPEYRESTIENFKKREIGQASDRYDIEIITKDDRRKYIELSLKTLEGEFMGIEGIAREIINEE